jgi:hypothetical protein
VKIQKQRELWRDTKKRARAKKPTVKKNEVKITSQKDSDGHTFVQGPSTGNRQKPNVVVDQQTAQSLEAIPHSPPLSVTSDKNEDGSSTSKHPNLEAPISPSPLLSISSASPVPYRTKRVTYVPDPTRYEKDRSWAEVKIGWRSFFISKEEFSQVKKMQGSALFKEKTQGSARYPITVLMHEWVRSYLC